MNIIFDRIVQRYESENKKSGKLKNGRNLYLRLYNEIKHLIQENEIPEGNLLPPTRQLAAGLQISRSTVIKAYELLIFEGYLTSIHGSGYRVKNIASTFKAVKSNVLSDVRYPDLSDVGKSFLGTVNLQNSTDDVSIAFRPGLPPLDIFPVGQWKNLTNLYWRHINSSSLTYSSTSGNEQLKRNLAAYLNLTRKIKCDPQQIIVVSGSLQSLFVLGSVLLNPGDKVTIENPTFPNVHSIFKGLRGDILPVNVDAYGLDVDALNQEKYKQSKIIHTVPSCHYPSGIKMSPERRMKLVQWASENNVLIIENDYEHEINNYIDFQPSLFSLDQEQRTVFLGTFNRLLHPSIRVGYMVVPYFLLNTVEAFLKHSHRFVPSSIQVVLSQFIEKNFLYHHIKNVVSAASERKVFFDKTFKNLFQNQFTLSDSSTKSLHTVAYLNSERNDTELIDILHKNSLICHSYSKCYVSNPQKHGLILGYSAVRTTVIKQKLIQMEGVLRKNNFQK